MFGQARGSCAYKGCAATLSTAPCSTARSRVSPLLVPEVVTTAAMSDSSIDCPSIFVATVLIRSRSPGSKCKSSKKKTTTLPGVAASCDDGVAAAAVTAFFAESDVVVGAGRAVGSVVAPFDATAPALRSTLGATSAPTARLCTENPEITTDLS